MTLLPALLFVASTVSADPHLADNPVYQMLRDGQVNGAADAALKMPEPVMADGLTAAQQQQVIKKIAGTPNIASFMRESVRALPVKIRIEKVDGVQDTFRHAHYYYIAYGELDNIANQDFFQGQLNGNNNAKVTVLTAEDLEQRGIKDVDQNHEGYGYVTTDVIKKLELSTLGRGFWSKTEDSIVFASIVDPRFAADKEYPNQWREKQTNNLGAAKLGPPQPYGGSGIYTKITELKQPKGALFIETQMYFHEPKGWFGGRNLLGAKLPATIKISIIPDMRRSISNAKPPKTK